MKFDFYRYESMVLSAQETNDAYRLSPCTEAVLGLSSEAGEVAQFFRKKLRLNHLTESDKLELLNELGDTLYYLTLVCYLSGTNFSEVADANRKKLVARGYINE